jgi:serine/threonine protein kinase
VRASGRAKNAERPGLKRIVAIKVPRAGSLASGQELDRFLREARSVAQLLHPSIVPVHEVGQVDLVRASDGNAPASALCARLAPGAG